MSLRRAEWHRRWGKERARKQTAFIANPFSFTQKLLRDKWSGHLECSPDEFDTFLRSTLSDSTIGQELDCNKALIRPAPPKTEFNIKKLSLKEVQEVIKAARSEGQGQVEYHTVCTNSV